MSPLHPFQATCLLGSEIFLAAAGPKLYGIDIHSGNVTTLLPVPISTSANGTDSPSPEEPQAKRRKVSPTQPDSTRSSPDSISITTERAKGERRRPKPPASTIPPPTISHILTTNKGKHIVLITTEDKAISVFSINSSASTSTLHLLSRRVMPKRICAASLIPPTSPNQPQPPDQTHLIVGDKFGDVYELPLHQTPDWKPPTLPPPSPNTTTSSSSTYQPSATNLTVHTKGNLAALSQQLKLQQSRAAKSTQSEDARGPGYDFAARLLLGHVSLLTDVTIAQRTTPEGKVRRYVLSADRDEHVRVSRWPQGHVVEGYCLGMGEFVGCVRDVPWVVSRGKGGSVGGVCVVGTGEPAVRVYEWVTGSSLAVERFDGEGIRERIEVCVRAGEGREGGLAVRGVWPVQVDDGGEVETLVVVALEGVPLLFTYLLTLSPNLSSAQLKHIQTLPLPHNPLTVTILPTRSSNNHAPTIIVNFDTAHLPGSTLTYTSLSTDAINEDTPTTQPFHLLRWTSDETGWAPVPPSSGYAALTIATSSDRPRIDDSSTGSSEQAPLDQAATAGEDGGDGAGDDQVEGKPPGPDKKKKKKTKKEKKSKKNDVGVPDQAVEGSSGVPGGGQRPGSGTRRGRYSKLGEVLYGLENLRKRRADTTGGAVGDDAGDEAGEEMADDDI